MSVFGLVVLQMVTRTLSRFFAFARINSARRLNSADELSVRLRERDRDRDDVRSRAAGLSPRGDLVGVAVPDPTPSNVTISDSSPSYL